MDKPKERILIMETLKFILEDGKELQFIPERLYCLAYAGRTKEDRAAHAQDVAQGAEMEAEPELGFGEVPALLITQDKRIQVLGEMTAGEVEFVLFVKDNDLYITLGSDHADRKMELMQSDLAKMVCAKPIPNRAWRYTRELAEEWDSLQMRSETYSNGKWDCSQQSCVDALLHPDDIIKEIRARNLPLEDGCIYYCGTVAVEDGHFWYGEKYRISLSMPDGSKELSHQYDIGPLVKKVTDVMV